MPREDLNGSPTRPIYKPVIDLADSIDLDSGTDKKLDDDEVDIDDKL